MYLQGLHRMEKTQTLQMGKFQRLIRQQCETLPCFLPKMLMQKKD